MQTVLLGSSGSAIVEFIIPEAGSYVMVDHHFAGGFLSSSTSTFTLFSAPVVLGTATANAQGVVSLTATIPASTTPGAHRIEVSGRSEEHTSELQSLLRLSYAV